MVQDTRIIVLSYFPPNQDYNTDEHDDIDDHDDKDRDANEPSTWSKVHPTIVVIPKIEETTILGVNPKSQFLINGFL